MAKKKVTNDEKVEKKKSSNTKKYVIFSLIIIVVISLLGFAAYKILAEPKKDDDKRVQKVNETEIKGYGIFIDDSDSKIYHEEFDKLKANLESKEINYDEYAESVAKMFIIDLYTIKNKINKYDIGGIDFVYPSIKQNYIDNVDDTLYKYVEDNSTNERSQNLPVVKSIEVLDTTKGKFTIESEKKEYDSYTYKLKWDYSLDLGYDTAGEVIVINKDNKMYVVEKN